MAAPDDVWPPASRRVDLMGESGWTERAVAEIWWTRPRCDLTCNVDLLREVLNEDWIGDQLDYHVNTGKKYARQSRRFTVAAIALFAVSAVAALLHSLGVGPELVRPATPWDYLSIVVPAIGAAIIGYAAKREYESQSERKRRLATPSRNPISLRSEESRPDPASG